MWALVLIISTVVQNEPGSYTRNIAAMTNIPGFETEAKCKEEGDKWQEQWQKASGGRFGPIGTYNCIEVR